MSLKSGKMISSVMLFLKVITLYITIMITGNTNTKPDNNKEHTNRFMKLWIFQTDIGKAGIVNNMPVKNVKLRVRHSV